MPFLTPALFEVLTAARYADADIVIPRTVRGIEPLCAVYSKRCGPSIHERIRRGELQASTLPDGLCVVEIGPDVLAAIDDSGRLFANVNTPHDYARAKDLIELKPDPTQDPNTE